MLLSQRVAVANVRVFHAVEQHVHAADAEHRVVEVEAVEHTVVKVLAELSVVEDSRVALAQVLARRDQEARRAAGRVADHVGGLRRRELDHEPDYVAWGAELAVLPGGGNLGKHVLVHIALSVAVVHGHLFEQVHHFCQEPRRRDGEAGIPHVVRVG